MRLLHELDVGTTLRQLAVHGLPALAHSRSQLARRGTLAGLRGGRGRHRGAQPHRAPPSAVPKPIAGTLPSGHPLLIVHRNDFDSDDEQPLRRFASEPAATAAAAVSNGVTTASGSVAAATAGTATAAGAAGTQQRADATSVELTQPPGVDEDLGAGPAVAPGLTIGRAVGLGLACGGVSGMVSRAVVHPFDTLRVLQSVSSTQAAAQVIDTAEVPMMQRVSAASSHWMQTASRALKDGKHILKTSYHNWHLGPASNPLYDTLQLRESVKILYRGYSVSVLGAQPVYALYFGAYEAAKHKLSSSSLANSEGGGVLSSPSFHHVLAGFLAECCAVVLWNPWEVVRQRMQLSSGTAQRTMFQTTQDVVRESGVRGLYAGVGGYIALWGTFSPLMFLMYEKGMTTVYGQQKGASITPSFGMSFLVGSLSGFVASAITSPFDVVKTRMQVQTPTSITYYENVYQGLHDIAEKEGPKALFRGTLARSLNQGLAAGIMLGSYGVMRAHAAKKMGWVQPRPEEGAGALAEPLHRNSKPRLQSWVTPASYDESMWPSEAKSAGGGQARVVERRGAARTYDVGFIPPLTRLATDKAGASAAGEKPLPSTQAAAADTQNKKKKPPPKDHGFIRPLGGW